MKLALIEQYKGLPRQIYILLAARVIIAMGSFVFPFLTFFLSSRLNFSEAEIAKYLLVVAVSYLPAALIGGKLADKFNRKYVYVTVLLISDIFFILAGFDYENVSVIFLILGGYFFINMGMPVLSAMTMDITTKENRQESFSLLYLGYNLGFAAGPLVAGMLFENYIRWIFWGEAMLNLVALVLIAFFVTDARPKLTDHQIQAEKRLTKEERKLAKGGSLLYQLSKNPIVVLVAVLGSAYSFAYSQMGYIMPLHMEDLFGIGIGTKAFGIMWSLNGLVVVAATPIMVLLFKKHTSLFNIAMAGVLYGIGFGLYGFSNNLFVMYALVFIWSSGEVLSATNTGVFIAEHAPETHRARFQSIYDIVQGTGRAVGPLIMGSYLTGHSSYGAWIIVGAACLVAAGAYFTLNGIIEGRRKKQEDM